MKAIRCFASSTKPRQQRFKEVLAKFSKQKE